MLLTVLSPISNAAEKLPLTDFVEGIRHQLHSIQQSGRDQSVPAMIKNVHVELHVITEKDQDGKTAYYVIEGMVEKKDLVTQKLSFDLELQAYAAVKDDDRAYRSYSTRRKDYRYGTKRFRPPRQYPNRPDQYMPDIYPVILFNKDH